MPRASSFYRINGCFEEVVMGRVKLFSRKKENTDGGRPAFTVALAGNPNVGKSTLFNSLTGMHAHTGNWTGKTVDCESAVRRTERFDLSFVDIPGTYSLFSHSDEEKIARNFICFGEADATVVVVDASALEQNLNLVIQICETGRRVMVLVNFIEEASRHGISIDLDTLSSLLGVRVVGVEAREKRALASFVSALSCLLFGDADFTALTPVYPEPIERAAESVSQALPKELSSTYRRWLALRLLDSDVEMSNEIFSTLSLQQEEESRLSCAIDGAKHRLFADGIDGEKYKDFIVTRIVAESERISSRVVKRRTEEKTAKLSLADRLLTGRFFAYPAMLLLLALVFWITLSLASYPSELLSRFFSFLEPFVDSFLVKIGLPDRLREALVLGMLRTLGQVVAVMLPPMAIFFPLFALLEDSGYLPRIAYNLDRPFACAGACGKQALTMCMGFGCNAVGITGSRIIDSKRERLLAILTNSLVPCNGRLPMMITLITVLCLFYSSSVSSVMVALFLSFGILIGIFATFLVTALLSRTLLRGTPSSFTVELPPYRRPQFFKVILHSLFDKCLSVLGRAVTVAAPMGLLIWFLTNLSVGEGSLLSAIAGALDPVGRFFGMDGTILLAFLLGLPANEIVIPLMLMIYSSGGAITAEVGIEASRAMLLGVGWTPTTAICTLVFALFHFPCSTSLITVYKETKSLKYTALAFILPTLLGLSVCMVLRAALLLF